VLALVHGVCDRQVFEYLERTFVVSQFVRNLGMIAPTLPPLCLIQCAPSDRAITPASQSLAGLNVGNIVTGRGAAIDADCVDLAHVGITRCTAIASSFCSPESAWVTRRYP
jgi:hypothetical protein